MFLAYIHPGDLELKYWLVILLVAGVIMLVITVAFVFAFVAILKAVDRRIEKGKSRAAG
jgi:hypothetical protein